MKQYGGNLAFSGGRGNPVMAGVGGTIYGIGSLVDNEENKKE